MLLYCLLTKAGNCFLFHPPPLGLKEMSNCCLSPSMLQKQGTNKKARGPTREEFGDFLRDLLPEIQAFKAKNGWPAVLANQEPVLSWDNNRIHDSPTKWAEVKQLYPFKLLGIPPYSPDIHSVIEHSHATLTSAFQKYVNQCPHTTKMQEYIDQLKVIFHQVITPASIQGDCQRLLTQVLPWIISSGGTYPPRQLR